MRKVALLLALVVSSCATSMAQVDRAVGADKPLAYREGYRDGCDTGEKAAGNPYKRFAKDLGRYDGDRLYHSGWDDGFAICKGQYESIGRALN